MQKCKILHLQYKLELKLIARQYKTIAIVGVVVLVIVSYAFSPLVGLGYLIGAALSGIAGYVGMLVSVQANVRTAEASEKV